jgi:sugar (pentulose or hexulose) kinase
MAHGRGHMVRAILEGTAYALYRDIYAQLQEPFRKAAKR